MYLVLFHSEGDQPWDFLGRNDAEAETPVLWPPHAKSWLIGKDFDAGRDWGQEEKGTPKDEMAGWHHWLNGRESEWTPGDGDGQGGLACCNSWGRKESDTTERLNWTELNKEHIHFLLIQERLLIFCNIRIRSCWQNCSWLQIFCEFIIFSFTFSLCTLWLIWQPSFGFQWTDWLSPWTPYTNYGLLLPLCPFIHQTTRAH